MPLSNCSECHYYTKPIHAKDIACSLHSHPELIKAMNKQQIIHQLFCLSNKALIDGEDEKDLIEPQAPFVTIRLCLVSSENYRLFYGEDLINEEPFTSQRKLFVDEYLFPETSLDECSFLFDRLQNSLSTSSDNLGDNLGDNLES